MVSAGDNCKALAGLDFPPLSTATPMLRRLCYQHVARHLAPNVELGFTGGALTKDEYG